MLIQFPCESCGKCFHVDERFRGRRGRCSQCGHLMRIPAALAASPAVPGVSPETDAATAREEALFKLSPAEPRPVVRSELPSCAELDQPGAQSPAGSHGSVLGRAAPLLGDQPQVHEHHGRFELLDDDTDPAAVLPVSPEIARGLSEIAEFEKDRREYNIEGDRRGFFSRLENSRPAGWIYVKWRVCVGFVLKILRWIDSSAYLISVPFITLMVFGIVIANRALVHTGAVVVVLANYGRFWADLLAFFVRPYKDGPLQGVAFLFPPYTLYYLTAHWDRMKPIVRRIATSCIPIVLVVLAYAFLPSVNPAVKDVKGVAAKIRAGKKEVDREVDSDLRKVESEIDSDLRKVENEVRAVAKPKKTAPEPKP